MVASYVSFFYKCYFKDNRKIKFLLKAVLGIFKMALCFRDQHIFMWHITGDFKCCKCFSVLQIWKKFSKKGKHFFENLECWFSVESTAVESAAFPYKSALSKAKIKTNRVGITNGPITKKTQFWYYFIFLKI